MTFAEKLKAARKAAGITQAKLAEHLGVSRRTIQSWEAELRLPPKYAQALILKFFEK